MNQVIAVSRKKDVPPSVCYVDEDRASCVEWVRSNIDRKLNVIDARETWNLPVLVTRDWTYWVITTSPMSAAVI